MRYLPGQAARRHGRHGAELRAGAGRDHARIRADLPESPDKREGRAGLRRLTVSGSERAAGNLRRAVSTQETGDDRRNVGGAVEQREVPPAADGVQSCPGNESRDHPVGQVRGTWVVVAGDDERWVPDGPQPGQARPAEQPSHSVHGLPGVLRPPDVHRAHELGLGAHASAEHGARHLLQPFRVIARWVDEVQERRRVAWQGEATEGGRDEHQPTDAVRVRDRHLLCHRTAERRAQHVSASHAELVEYRGAELRQRPHAHRQEGHLRAADARRVERDRAESLKVREQLLQEPDLSPDTGVEQQRLALPAQRGVDPDSPDAQLLVRDLRGGDKGCHRDSLLCHCAVRHAYVGQDPQVRRPADTNERSVGRSDLTHTGSVTQVTAPLDGQPNGRLRFGVGQTGNLRQTGQSLQRPPGAETGGKRQPSWPRAWRRIWMYTFAAPLDRALRIAADSCAVVCGDRREAYAEFGSRCRRLGGALRRLGLAPGDRVGGIGLNSDRYLELYLGIPAAGFVLVPVNSRLAAAEMRAILEDAGPSVLFADGAYAGAAAVERVVTMPDDYEDLISAADEAPLGEGIAEDDLAVLFYTSGTTGAAKGAMHSHRSLVSSGLHFMATWPFDRDTRWLVASPMFHTGGTIAMIATVWAGGTHVMMPSFDPDLALALIEREGVTHTLLVPTLLAAARPGPR